MGKGGRSGECGGEARSDEMGVGGGRSGKKPRRRSSGLGPVAEAFITGAAAPGTPGWTRVAELNTLRAAHGRRFRRGLPLVPPATPPTSLTRPRPAGPPPGTPRSSSGGGGFRLGPYGAGWPVGRPPPRSCSPDQGGHPRVLRTLVEPRSAPGRLHARTRLSRRFPVTRPGRLRLAVSTVPGHLHSGSWRIRGRETSAWSGCWRQSHLCRWCRRVQPGTGPYFTAAESPSLRAWRPRRVIDLSDDLIL